MSRTRQPSTRRIGAAERAIAVLDTLADAGELGTNEIARRTGMTPSTVSRQLGTLAASGLVERVAAIGRYRLGLRIVHLANALLARLDVREVARPHLVALVEATGETATLSVPGDEDAITVDFVPGAITAAGLAARPALGRACDLGREGDARLLRPRASRRAPLRAYTPRTITDPQALAREIAQVRERGWAQALGEREPDLTAIAAPSARAAESSRRSSRSRARARASTLPAMEAAVPLLVEQADAISRELGWRLD